MCLVLSPVFGTTGGLLRLVLVVYWLLHQLIVPTVTWLALHYYKW